MKKIRLAALAAVTASLIAQTASAEYSASITGVSADGASVYITKTADTALRGIAASYGENGELIGISVSDEIPRQTTGEAILTLSPPSGGTVKYFLWQTDSNGALTPVPAAAAYTPSSPEQSPSPTPTATPTSSPEITGGGTVHLLGDSIDASGAEGVAVSGTTADITAAGEYTFDGTLTDGAITVSAPKDTAVTINLDGVSVTSSTGDAFSASNGKITLCAAADTVNTFSATAEGARGIYSKQDLTLKSAATGTISVSSAADNGIQSKKDIEIGAGSVIVNAANNGIKGSKSVKITKKNKAVTVVSGGDGIKSDLAPSLDSETGEYVSGGTVAVNGGTVTITANTVTEADGTVSNGDGIQADTLLSVSGGTINITAAGEALKANASSIADATPAEGDGCVVITGGTITASAGEDGIKAVRNVTVSDSADITLTKSQDGIQVDETVYAADGTTVSAYVEGSIDITGGALDITSSEDGIQCGTGNITVTGGEVTVNSVKDCVQAEKILNITGGTFSLKANGGANGSTTEESCKGLKGGVLVNISGGTFDIDAYDDAVHSNDTVRISGGKITAASSDDGIHGDCYLIISDNADINITKSYEGIEAAKIYITGGKTFVVSSDDGVNAAGDEPSGEAKSLDSEAADASLSAELFAGWGGPTWGGPTWGGEDTSNYGYVEVSGGLVYVEAEGDGFDSNGNGLITGGTVLVNGPTNGGNGVFDVGDNGNTLTITGGTVIGAGTSDMAVTPTSATASQYYVTTGSSSGVRPGQSTSSGFSSQAAGTPFKLSDASGNEIAVYVPSKKYSWILVSTPEMTSGSYTLTYGGSVSGGSFTKGSYGIVTGGSYSGGTAQTLTATK